MRHVGHGARRRRWADLGLGFTSGNGRLLVSWIHDIEFVNALDWRITREHIAGAIHRVVPGRLREDGFPFPFPPRDQAARDLCSRWRHQEGAVE